MMTDYDELDFATHVRNVIQDTYDRIVDPDEAVTAILEHPALSVLGLKAVADLEGVERRLEE